LGDGVTGVGGASLRRMAGGMGWFHPSTALGSFVILVFLVMPSTPGDNEHGAVTDEAFVALKAHDHTRACNADDGGFDSFSSDLGYCRSPFAGSTSP
jgi:hypothetical protein